MPSGPDRAGPARDACLVVAIVLSLAAAMSPPRAAHAATPVVEDNATLPLRTRYPREPRPHHHHPLVAPPPGAPSQGTPPLVTPRRVEVPARPPVPVVMPKAPPRGAEARTHGAEPKLHLPAPVGVVPAPPPAASAPPPPPAAAATEPGEPAPKIPRFAALKTDDTNMRKGPGQRYPIEWVYQRRDLPVEVEREYDVWRLVRDADGIEGWVHQVTLSDRRTFLVTEKDATLRAGATDTAAAVAVLKVGVIGRLRECDQGSTWCQVQVGGYKGYLRRDQFWGLLPDEVLAPS